MDPDREMLFFALLLFKVQRTPSSIDSRLREHGLEQVSDVASSLSGDEVDELRRKADDLADRGIFVVMRGMPEYPETLVRNGKCFAPVLFCYGNVKLLKAEGVGMCGSRSVSELGLKAATACGEEVSNKGLSVISGYAKGVDTATHLAALRSGGSTVIVLAEGFDHFRVKRVFAEEFDLDRIIVISQFAPTQPWLAHAAMTRNRIIFGLSRALVVVEAGERGGTLAAGEGAIRLGRPVFVLNFGSETPAGNKMLLSKGGFSVDSRESLGRILNHRPPKNPAQMSLPL